MRVKLLLILLTLIIPFSSFGKEKMEPLFDLNEATIKKLKPEIYSTKKKEISGIFDIPIDNAIASNSVPGTNAITLITFKKGKVKYKTLIKNFKSYVSGGSTHYLPIFSDDWIGYSQNRGFNLINIKKKKARYYSIVGGFDNNIAGIHVVNSDKKLFLFDCISYNENETGFLVLMDLTTEEGKIIAQKNDHDAYCTTIRDIVFTYSENSIKAYDNSLTEITHPLLEIFNKQKSRFKNIEDMAVHPSLPIAVFCDSSLKETWMISWDKNKSLMRKIFNFTSAWYEFSSDNNWLIFQLLKSRPKQYMIMPCGEEYPNFLGKPILLGDVPEFPSGWGTTAVTRNPAGFVIPGTDDYGDSYWLKKWDFTKAEELIEKE